MECEANCFGYNCDFWVSYDPDYSCTFLEANYSCDCSNCECFEPHDKCTTNCFGSDCDDYVALGYTCSDMEDIYGCDCDGCTCNEIDTVMSCEASTDCATGRPTRDS